MSAGGRRPGGSSGGRVFILLALVLIVILAAVAFVLRGSLLSSLQPAAQNLPTPTPSGEMVEIVVLAQPVSRGSSIPDSALTKVWYPKKNLVEGLFFTDAAKVQGKRAKFDLQAGMPLTPSLISDTQTGSLASFQIPAGYTAISIPINRLTAVSYALQPGDHVNVIASMLLVDVDTNFQSRLPNGMAGIIPAGSQLGDGKTAATTTIDVQNPAPPFGRAEVEPVLNTALFALPSENQRPRLVSQTLVQDAVVLGIGTFSTPKDTTNQEGNALPTPTPSAASAAPAEPDLITLVVSPQDAVSLNYMMLAGAKLNLVLRSAGDTQRAQTESVTLQFIMDQYSIPLPAKLPYAQEPRVDKLAFPNEGQPVTAATPQP